MPDIPANPPLGAAKPPFETRDVLLSEECLLVFFTDGLIRPAGEDIDEGIAHLTRTAVSAVAEISVFPREGRPGGRERIDTLCDMIASDLLRDEARRDDDAALLIAHARPTAATDVRRGPSPRIPGRRQRPASMSATNWPSGAWAIWKPPPSSS
ncbi:hypothetical protein QFZ66_001187 [Streptomyces sp. B4I13]|nr:hypothetical protein [Streptomyces sp. B4I13]